MATEQERASRPCDASEATKSRARCPGGSSGAGRDFNDDVEDELGARTPSSPSTTRRQASLSADRGRLARHTHRKCRRSPRPVSLVLARCDPTHARATRQRRCLSSGSPPQRCHRRSASRSSPHCPARDALPAPPNAGGHGRDVLPAARERRRGRDRRRPPPVPYPQDVVLEHVDPQLMHRAVLHRDISPRRSRQATQSLRGCLVAEPLGASLIQQCARRTAGSGS